MSSAYEFAIRREISENKFYAALTLVVALPIGILALVAEGANPLCYLIGIVLTTFGALYPIINLVEIFMARRLLALIKASAK
jgi:hypothetical protein